MSWLDTALGGYTDLQQGGVALPRRRIANFVGATLTDDPANARTVITITGGGGGGYDTVEGNGLAVTQRTTINLIGAAAVADNSGSSRTDVTVGPAPAAVDGFYCFQMVSGVPTYVQITQDMISAGLTVALSGGGGGTFQCGDTWTLSGVTASPACNAAGVTAATLTEIINSVSGTSVNDLGQGNPLTGAQLPHTSYTRSGSGDVVDLQLAMTKGGFTKSSTLGQVRGTFLDCWYVGQDTAGDGTGATTATATTATLTGGAATATISGTIATFPVGASFTIPASPGTPKYTYLWVPHTASAMTFKSGGGPFAMARVTNNSAFSNHYSVSHNFDLYVTNALTQAYTVTRDT